MSRSLSKLALILALALPSWGQFSTTATRVVRGGGLPATCTVGAVWMLGNISSGTLYVCTAPNTWTLVTGGGGGAVTSVTMAGTANQITVTGTCTITTTGTCTFSLPTNVTIGGYLATSNATFTNVIGTGGVDILLEGSATSAVAGTDVIYGDSSAHKALLSNNGGTAYAISQLIAAGTVVVPVTALAANTCDAAATTAVAIGALTSDRADLTYAVDPTAITGYGGGTSGGISIRSWLTADTLNIKRCNETGSSITPGALTLNWGIAR